jgi:hypothetical protein
MLYFSSNISGSVLGNLGKQAAEQINITALGEEVRK